MQLFGPNIKKMKENRDIGGLSVLLKADNMQTQVEASEALLELGDATGLEAITKRYSDVFKFGDKADKVELMIMMQGRYSGLHTDLAWVAPLSLPEASALRIMKIGKITFRRKPELNLTRPILFETAASSAENPLIRLFALTSLVELGDRSNEVMQLMATLLLGMEEPNIWNVNETLRALSYFSNSPEVAELFIRVQKGDLFAGEKAEPCREAAIFALGATSTPSAREYLEYLATGNDKIYKKKAQVALGLFGRATFDEIKARC